MAGYRLFFKESVQKDFEGIAKKDSKRILNRIKSLGDNPRWPGCEKLAGLGCYRLRQGRYRILYTMQDEERSVTVVKIGHRKDIYR
jgi:mRNA interferase RelE/StbE